MKSPILWLSFLVGSVGLPALSLAQQPVQFQPRTSGGTHDAAQRDTQGVSQDLRGIYQQTATADDEAAMTAIARACAKIIPDAKRTRVDRDYASNLFAWALNRRGEIRNEQAAMFVEQGQIDQASRLDQQAAKDFETAIEYNSKNWRMHHNLAISLAMKGDYPKAIAEFSAAIDLNPDYANSHFNRAELYFELSQYPQAIDGYTQAIALSAADPQYFNSRGHCRFMLESYDDAIADYRRATELGTDSAVYATDLADAYQFLGRWEEAAQAYRAAVAANSKYPRAYQNAAWLMATCPDAKIRNVDLALSAAKKAIELSGERTSQAIDTLAAATAAVGKHGEAASLQKEAVKLAAQDEKAEMSQRLQLYERGQGFTQAAALMIAQPTSAASRIRTASGSSREAAQVAGRR